MLIRSLFIAYKHPRSFSRFALQCTISCGWLATVSVGLSFVFMLQYHREKLEKVTSHIIFKDLVISVC
jgi:hypothetical protein